MEAIRKANHVFIIGNGGSYANADHICNDLLNCGVKAFTLNPSYLTASANDFSYAESFARWLSVVGEPGDVLVALSGSGQSANILRAIDTARAKGMEVIRIYGAYNQHSGENLVLRGKDMQDAEDKQLVWGHEVMRALKCA